MTHRGRHEMPGWRGYLPESVDRASRRRSGGDGTGTVRPGRRVAALGALAACALAGGALIQTRSDGPPSVSPGADDDAAALARSSAWTREAVPVLAAVEAELRRADGLRRQWDASAPARRAGPAPDAVVALLERRTDLARHRDALRATMAAIRDAPGSDTAMANAWPQLRAAQEMVRALAAGRGVGGVGDPVEATVLRLVLDEDAPARDARTSSGGRGEVAVALAASTSETVRPRVVSTARSGAASTPAPVAARAADVTEAVEDTEAVETVETVERAVAPAEGEIVEEAVETSRREAPAPVPDVAGSDTDDGDPEPPEEPEEPEPPEAPEAVPPSASSEPTMLTFERPSPTSGAEGEEAGTAATTAPATDDASTGRSGAAAD